MFQKCPNVKGLEKTFSAWKRLLTHREMSTDEAIHRLLSIPLTESNRKVIFLPTELPEQRTRLLKSKKELESLPDDSVDIFQTSIVDRYAARP